MTMPSIRLFSTVLALTLLGCSVRLVGDLPEKEANRIVSELEKHDIPAKKAPDGKGRTESWSVHVSREDAPAAREITANLALPRPADAGLSELLEQSSIVPSASQERLRESIALGREIGSSLEKLQGVVEADVLIAVPDEGPRPGQDQDPPSASASVLVRHTRKPDVSTEQVQDLVAGAVAGIEPADVTVVFSRVVEPQVPRREWKMLGPFQVASDARMPLAMILSIMAVMNLLLGAWAVLTVLRWRRHRPGSGEGTAPRDVAASGE